MAIAAIALSAGCTDQIIDNNTGSRFVTPSATGAISDPAAGNERIVNISGNGYAYEAGNARNGDIVAVAGIIPGTSASPTPGPDHGSTTYSGRYEMVTVGGFFLNDGKVVGFSRPEAGDIALSVDFAARTIRGTADDLTVNGEFNGNVLSGNVRYDGISGDLRGVMGGDKAVGAFHGESSERIFAGGFYVTPD
ncbi:hypothetical protein [Yoonia vestfoldensis]|uniref:hypothetical protein n=1 Tax=Yoonia vestfoldensis TaxID=245188 RepID=UPI0013A59E71|nr:hypothetical protein [Yoonia vestfoldensis]